MVYTSNAIITAILAVSAAAPILAAPVGPRIDSGSSSVTNRAPAPPPPTQPPATEPEAVPAPNSAITGGAASDAPPSIDENWNPLDYSSSSSSGSFQSAAPNPAPPNPFLSVPANPVSPNSFLSAPSNQASSNSFLSAPANPASPNSFQSAPSNAASSDSFQSAEPGVESPPPSTGPLSKLTSLVNTPVKAVLTGLAVGGTGVGAGVALTRVLNGHRDLDADTLHLPGRDLDTDALSLLFRRDLEDIFARSFGTDELD